MFKDSVFRPSVSTIKWFKATIRRCIRTMAQTMLGFMTSVIFIEEVDWKVVMSATFMSGLSCFLMALKGIPEVSADDNTVSEEPEFTIISDEDV